MWLRQAQPPFLLPLAEAIEASYCFRLPLAELVEAS